MTQRNDQGKGDQSLYSSDWVKSAWGDADTRALLEGRPIIPRPRVQRALEISNLKPGLRLLDIACGRGEIVALASEQGLDAIGMDYAAEPMRIASLMAEQRSGASGVIRLLRGDATALPFKEGSFDRITMLDIVEHLHPAELSSMFREVRRVLKPDGFATVHTLPNRWQYEIAYPTARFFMPHLPANPRNAYEKLIHVNEQDIVGLSSTLSEAGFSSRIWLEQQLVAQARWNHGNTTFGDHRDPLYAMLSGPLGKVVEILSRSPLKLLLCNDIYALLWHASGSRPGSLPEMPCAPMERMAIRLGRLLLRWKSPPTT